MSGRGQLHLTVLIENMRREGFEMLVGPPTVITKQVDGKTHEPFETVEVQVRPGFDVLELSVVSDVRDSWHHVR